MFPVRRRRKNHYPLGISRAHGSEFSGLLNYTLAAIFRQTYSGPTNLAPVYPTCNHGGNTLASGYAYGGGYRMYNNKKALAILSRHSPPCAARYDT